VAAIPNEDWYTSQSRARKLPHHCPIASITGCPRYFASMDHAQRAKVLGGEIPSHVRDHLLEKWRPYAALMVDDAQVATKYSPKGDLRGVSNFCPEVSALLGGLYCSDYSVGLENSGEFSLLQPRHFTECPEFSALGYEEKVLVPVDRGVTPEKRFAVLKRDGFKCVYCGRGSKDVLLHVDHKISRANGGGDEVDNLVTSCSLCNNGKGGESAI